MHGFEDFRTVASAVSQNCVGAGGMALGVFVLAAADASGGAARNASATLVGLAEGTIMAAWTATVRQAFGAARFGTHVAVYNSAIALVQHTP